MATQTKPPVTGASAVTQPAKPKAGRFRRACRRIYKLITSHLGLIFFLVAFSFLGAAIFQAIEGDNERDEKADIQWLREVIIDTVWNASTAVKRNEHAFRLLMREEMKKYETQLYAAYGTGINTQAEVEVWDFWGSLFYCATVYTTIGYGNIYPSTDVGRVVTMIYALVGIPLCLIVLADLGKVFTRAIKWLWAFVRRFYYTRKFSRAAARRAMEEKVRAAAAAVARLDKIEEKTKIKQAPQEKTAKVETSKPVVEEVPVFVVDDEFNLPVSVAIVLTFLYILLGALIYCQWEQWSYLEAFYFVFISVSTIGFGDVLPEHPKYFLLSSVYVLIGLSLVAMVINVIMEAMTSHLDTAQKNIAEIARTVGIGIEEEDETSSTQNGAAQPVTQSPTSTVTTSAVVTPATPITPSPASNAFATPITPSPAGDVFATPMTTPAPQDTRPPGYFSRGPDLSPSRRGRPPYRPDDPRSEEYNRRDAPDFRPQEFRGRDEYRPDYRNPQTPSRPDPRMDPRMDPRADPRMDPRVDPRMDPRADPRMGDPRMDPRADPRLGDPRMDPRMADPRGPRSPQSYGPQQNLPPQQGYVS